MALDQARAVPSTTRPGQRERAASGWGKWLVVARGASILITAVISFAACSGREGVSEPISAPDGTNELDEAEAPGAAFVAPTLVPTVTYDGSGQLVHPDAAVFPRRWQGQRYWIAATPYPSGNPKYENPSIYQGQTSREMIVPAGVTNPIVAPPTVGYMSDPDILHDVERDELRMYYRQTAGESDQIFLITSRNGIQWSPAQLVVSDVRYSLISPAVVRESATSWRMWTVNASAQGCYSLLTELVLQQRRSQDGLAWSAPEPVLLRVPGRIPWHWDVQYVAAKSEYWALIAAYPAGTTCSQSSVYFARSTDGTNWNVSTTPLLGPGEFEPIRDLVYRSSFHYHDGSDAVSVWFSGARLEGRSFHYSVASARYPFPQLLRRVNGANSSILERSGSNAVSTELRTAREAFERDFP
jgi:hypothetical protein